MFSFSGWWICKSSASLTASIICDKDSRSSETPGVPCAKQTLAVVFRFEAYRVLYNAVICEAVSAES